MINDPGNRRILRLGAIGAGLSTVMLLSMALIVFPSARYINNL